MLAVQPRSRCQCDEELRAVGVGSGIGHAENACAAVLELGADLVLELLSIDTLTSSTGTRGIASLNHEVWYYAVEYQAVEVVALRKRREVFACLGRVVVVEFDDNSALLCLVGGSTVQ
jgi:hypothetical protein